MVLVSASNLALTQFKACVIWQGVGKADICSFNRFSFVTFDILFVMGRPTYQCKSGKVIYLYCCCCVSAGFYERSLFFFIDIPDIICIFSTFHSESFTVSGTVRYCQKYRNLQHPRSIIK